VIDAYINPDEDVDADQKCAKCGAAVLLGCTACGMRIRGGYFVPGVIGFSSKYKPPAFCDGCGAAHPWASRQERIYELENILDEQPEIDEADKIFLHERLAELRAMDGSDAKAEERLWKIISQRSHAFVQNPAVRRIAENLVTQAVRAWLFT
jgi:hypothetical protein